MYLVYVEGSQNNETLICKTRRPINEVKNIRFQI